MERRNSEIMMMVNLEEEEVQHPHCRENASESKNVYRISELEERGHVRHNSNFSHRVVVVGEIK